MKKYVVNIVTALSVFLSAPVFAGHDHGSGGSHDSSEHSASHSQANEQTTKTADQLLKECSQHLDNIQRHISRLQSQLVDGKSATSAINGELEQLEQHLKEAKDLVRSLRVF
jgi:peptidoglycan hydrolase CwlO-like protein